MDGGGQLQVAPGGIVEDHEVLHVVGRQYPDMLERAPLGLPQVMEDGAGGADRGGQIGTAEGLERGTLEEFPDQPGSAVGGHRPVGHRIDHAFGQGRGQGTPQRLPLPIVDQQHFPRLQRGQFAAYPLQGTDFGDAEFAGGDVEQGHPVATRAGADEGHQVVVLLGLQGFGVDHQPRGDDPHHLPLDDALGLARVLHLLADGHLVAVFHQAVDVGLATVVGDAAQRDFVLRPLVAGGQGDVQHPRGGHGILEEHFVEVPQAEKQDGVGNLGFYFEILPHHRRQGSHGAQFTSGIGPTRSRQKQQHPGDFTPRAKAVLC